ncbi:MAG: hypothetical protein D6784_16925 [Chloroflexi bacterium]|nr:MAG: hypothetical protein D6784_16925 [Chloroflexota bacterium]
MKETLLELGIWPDRVTHLYYPLGATHPVLALHPYVPLVSLPFTLLSGPLVSYNLAFLLGFILSGLTGYLLTRYVCRHTGAAIIGGIIFAFYPNRLGHAAAGHLLLTTNYFLPLYALSLLVLLRRPSVRRAVWHGVVTALLALAQPTHIGYGIIPVFLFLGGGHIVTLIRQPSIRKSASALLHSFFWLAAAILLAIIMFLPFAWPTLVQNQQGELAYLTPKDLTKHTTDLLAFLLPSPYNPVLASLGLIPPFSAAIIDGFRDLEEQLAYPGILASGLAILAIWKRWRAAWPWFALTLTCMLLSLGPLLKIGGEIQTLTLPYAWLGRLPFFAWSRAPGRLNETVMMGVAVLASIGAAWLLPQSRSFYAGIPIGKRTAQNRNVLFLILIGAFILIEYPIIFPFPTEVRPISSYYFHLASQTFQGGILEMPVTGSRRASNYAMYYQTVHQHPLAGGYIERDPPATVELKEFLNQLVSPVAPQTVLSSPDESTRRAILADMHITQVIAHPSLMTDRAARATRDYLPLLLGDPVFQDEDIQVYVISQASGDKLPSLQLLFDQENWEVIKDGTALRLKKEGYLFIYATQAQNVDLRITLDAPSTHTTLSVKFNDGPEITYNNIDSTADYTIGALALQPGFNYLSLTTEPRQDIDFFKLTLEPAMN